MIIIIFKILNNKNILDLFELWIIYSQFYSICNVQKMFIFRLYSVNVGSPTESAVEFQESPVFIHVADCGPQDFRSIAGDITRENIEWWFGHARCTLCWQPRSTEISEPGFATHLVIAFVCGALQMWGLRSWAIQLNHTPRMFLSPGVVSDAFVHWEGQEQSS